MQLWGCARAHVCVLGGRRVRDGDGIRRHKSSRALMRQGAGAKKKGFSHDTGRTGGSARGAATSSGQEQLQSGSIGGGGGGARSAKCDNGANRSSCMWATHTVIGGDAQPPQCRRLSGRHLRAHLGDIDPLHQVVQPGVVREPSVAERVLLHVARLAAGVPDDMASTACACACGGVRGSEPGGLRSVRECTRRYRASGVQD